jgi:predicted nucleotidyltransferase
VAEGREDAALPAEIAAALAQWAAAAGCKMLVVFGSAARGRFHAGSDIDVALAFDELPPPRARLAMIGEIQDRCEGRRVDVVFLRSETDPVLRFEVFRTGRALHESTPGLFVDGAVRAMVAYEDALPFRRLLRDRVVRTATVR